MAALSTSWRLLSRAGVKSLRLSGLTEQRSFATSSKWQTTYGFIGLGQMGYPMAKNLRAKIAESDNLVIYDVNAESTERFAKEVGIAASSVEAPAKGAGVEIAVNPRAVAEQSDVVITVLPEPKHVKDVFFGILSVGELPPCSDGERLFIDCSTIDPTSSCDVANAIHSTKSGRFVDAPMSGGIVGARAGSLTFMLGASDGTSHLVDHVKTVLHHMGKKVWHLGGQGAGLSGKLANNYLLAVSNIAAAEAMNLGIKWGLEPSLLADMINSSSGRCWASEVNNPVPGVLEQAPASKGYEGGFGIGLMKKDLRLAMEAASEAGAKLELADKAKEVYESAEEIFPKKDFAVVYEWLSVERNGNGK